MTNPTRNLILLVDDDDVDALLLTREVNKLRPEIEVQRSNNGEEALLALSEIRPELILLDIRMPRMDGRETLTHIKADDALRDIPVVMLSTSADENDIRYCYDKHANAYIEKKVSVKCTRNTIDNLLEFWFDTALK